MSDLMFYAIIAALTIASPGPGIVLTLTNTLNYHFRQAFCGILGVATGMAIIGVISSSSLGVLLTTSPHALTVVKVVGAAYLIYLGIKMFRSIPKALEDDEVNSIPPAASKFFSEAFVITLFNPKPIVFFMALFPQFVDPSRPVTAQFATLIIIFCLLVIAVHSLYGYFATVARRKLSSENFFTAVNRVAGIVFMVFGTALGLSAI